MRALAVIFVLFAAVSVHGQSAVEADQRLFDVFETDYLNRMQADHPVMLARLNFYLDNAWFITEYPTEKGNPDLPEITIEDFDNLNILKLEAAYALSRDFNKRMMYSIKGTDKVLVYYSGKEFTESFNAFYRK